MKKIIDLSKKFGGTALSFTLPLLAQAAGAAPGPASASAGNTTPDVAINTTQGVLDFVCNIFAWMFYFLVALAVVFVVIGAYKYLTSSGDAEKVKSANNTLLYAAIAVAVALLARSIPLIVGDFLGASNAGTLQTC